MVTLFTVQSALACGGFFCNNIDPVLQKAERIVFVVDEVAETVETHVQVEYEGPADQFAWIVPVQAEPELFLTNEMLFTTVGAQLQPTFQLSWQEEGGCDWGGTTTTLGGRGVDLASSDDAEGGGVQPPQQEPAVEVVNRATVGPYDTVTLQADDVQSLMRWLEDNDYAIPSDASGAIAPYVRDGAYFVALKLVKGNDTGDLQPLGMRYHGTTPAVPIQLTSVAAADDLRLEVSIFGQRRAVPASYLHVQINEAAIDWFDWGSNYDEVITRAADEAGGHAFATDYAGSTDLLWANFAVDADLAQLAASSSPTDWIERLQSQGFQGSSDLLAFFERHFPVVDGLEARDVYNCPSCYAGWYDGPAFDAEAVTLDLQERIVEPRTAIEALIEAHPYVTRLTSSLSASEMTIDPTFVFNDRMGDQPLFHVAELVHECDGGSIYKADRRLELPDGRVIELPPMRWFEDQDLSEADYLEELGSLNAAVIERTGTGEPEIVADFRDQLADQVRRFNDQQGGGACGCSSTTGAVLPNVVIGLFTLLGLRRRR